MSSADRKGELEMSLRAFDARHDEFLRRLARLVGRVQRFAGKTPIGRWILVNVTTRIAAWAIVRLGILSVTRPRSGSAVDIAHEWQKLAVFFRVPVKIESASDERVVLIHPECTVGFCPGEEKICRASMNMDHEIVRRLGGTLLSTETIAAGGKHCRHVVEPRRRKPR